MTTKSCPLCGNPNVIIDYHGFVRKYRIRCDRCGVEFGMITGGVEDSPDRMVEAFNRRPSSSGEDALKKLVSDLIEDRKRAERAADGVVLPILDNEVHRIDYDLYSRLFDAVSEVVNWNADTRKFEEELENDG